MRKMSLLKVLYFILPIFMNGCDNDIEIAGSSNSSSSSSTSPDNEESVDEADANNTGDHDEDSDYIWSADDVVEITLNGSSITENTDGASASGSVLTITDAGNYSISGTLSNGQIIVDAEDSDLVRLILNGVDITSSNSAPIYIKKAEKVILVANENTVNNLTDGSSYKYDDEEDEEPNATVFSKTNLTIFGEGSLNINGNFNDAINCKDGLILACQAISIDAADDGIRGKDYLIIKEGNIVVKSEDDAIKSDNENDTALGYIKILDGEINITSGGDGITAQTDLLINNGTFNITTTGYVSSSNGVSSKGLKSAVNTIIEDGSFNIISTEDAIHSDETITIHEGTYTISASDDGIHADYDLTINDGDFNITKSYEGIESSSGNMYINGGTIELVASDDGINIAGGGGSMGGPHGGWGSSTSSSSYTMYLNPDYMAINAQGDGIDANGSVEVTGGIIIVNGPTGSGNGALDYDASFVQNGGTLIAVGSSGMLQAPGSSSSQKSIALVFRSTRSAGSICHIENTDGDVLFTFKSAKNYQSLVYSSPDLVSGTSYNVYSGGTASGDDFNGLYSNETYSGGTLITTFSLNGTVTGIQIN